MFEEYSTFVKEVRKSNRYVWSDSTTVFLEKLSECFHEREYRVPRGSKLFRSQIGYAEVNLEGENALSALPAKRMKPTPEFAKEGRSNPKGIPYLYLSNDKQTSMSELRPAVGEYISCGVFEAAKDLTLIDCHTTDPTINEVGLIFSPPDTPKKSIDATWFLINKEFSKPVKNSESDTNYVATQIVAELIKSKGYDGLLCKSHLGPGFNIVLFELDSAHIRDCHIL
ncbi:RES family NAD+ phosphorylase [Methylophaga sp. UBA2689]|uniref:RES family NAD+ phosphorylase n=1 Tax=Methylophaga sp. UBA2689 TaxID=1946878 RepID=UPI0025E2F70D|nr:RES family NAD+ phosphorylase [Methylophaga sp. UBA2689]|tara:strand:+ start:1920 stop:2597 length:678 start_codon:yes stop_codon:yes gene_type:complete